MTKLFLGALLLGLAGVAYWYFSRSKMDDVYDYAESARDSAVGAFDSASRLVSDAASRAGDRVQRAADAVKG